MGSSPRMRGARFSITSRNKLGRIIPAYAGSTTRPLRRASATADHPRVCGEHGSHPPASDRLPGSSPRMRGALKQTYLRWAVSRIILAYAGSTQLLGGHDACSEDHPRVCGEHATKGTDMDWGWGSSPRMRGALPLTRPERPASWIIPAYAGSTALSRASMADW